MDVVIFRILVEEYCFPLLTEGGLKVLEDKSFSFWLFRENKLCFIEGRREINGWDGMGNSCDDRTYLIECRSKFLEL